MYDTAYSKRLTLRGWNYYKAGGFFYVNIKKSEYKKGKHKEKLARKEREKYLKELRNS